MLGPVVYGEFHDGLAPLHVVLDPAHPHVLETFHGGVRVLLLFLEGLDSLVHPLVPLRKDVRRVHAVQPSADPVLYGVRRVQRADHVVAVEVLEGIQHVVESCLVVLGQGGLDLSDGCIEGVDVRAVYGWTGLAGHRDQRETRGKQTQAHHCSSPARSSPAVHAEVCIYAYVNSIRFLLNVQD